MKAKLYLLLIPLMLIGCAGSTGNISSDNPIERGLSYIAAAIVTHGILTLISGGK